MKVGSSPAGSLNTPVSLPDSCRVRTIPEGEAVLVSVTTTDCRVFGSVLTSESEIVSTGVSSRRYRSASNEAVPGTVANAIQVPTMDANAMTPIAMGNRRVGRAGKPRLGTRGLLWQG